MALPTSPITGQIYTDETGSVYEYGFNRWQRIKIAANNQTSYGSLPVTGETADVNTYQGYYSELTNFYFTGGVATETDIDANNVDQWIDVNFTPDPDGYFDYRPQIMKDAVPTQPLDPSTGIFTLEGLSLTSHVLFRASMTFEPEEDNGQLEARLLFNRHSGTTPSQDFAIEDVALNMQQGTDSEYPAEPFLSFFVGDTIDTNGADDSGKCRFQVKSNVNGTIRMRALTWYISA